MRARSFIRLLAFVVLIALACTLPISPRLTTVFAQQRGAQPAAQAAGAQQQGQQAGGGRLGTSAHADICGAAGRDAGAARRICFRRRTSIRTRNFGRTSAISAVIRRAS